VYFCVRSLQTIQALLQKSSSVQAGQNSKCSVVVLLKTASLKQKGKAVPQK
jgi:hypothetical protein